MAKKPPIPTPPQSAGQKGQIAPRNAAKAAVKTQEQLKKENVDHRALSRFNFIGMGIAGVLIVLGFILMLGEPSTPEHFNEDIFSTRRIVVGPMFTFLGFVLMAIAIIVNPRRKPAAKAEAESDDANIMAQS